MPKPLWILIATLVPAAFAATPSVPVEEQKRQFAGELSTVITDVEQSLARLQARVGTDDSLTSSSLEALQRALEEARGKWAGVNTSDPEQFDRHKDQAQRALSALQDAYYSAIAKFPDERRAQEQRAAESVASLQQMAADLRARATAGGEALRAEYARAVERIEKERRELERTLDKLRSADGSAWADIRKDIETSLAEARERYWDASRSDEPLTGQTKEDK